MRNANGQLVMWHKMWWDSITKIISTNQRKTWYEHEDEIVRMKGEIARVEGRIVRANIHGEMLIDY